MDDLLREIGLNLRTQWRRIALTGSGIAWGIGLFVCLSAMGQGSRLHYREKMEAIGRKVIYVFPGSIAGRSGGERSTKPVTLETEDAGRLPASPRVERAAAELWSGARVLEANGRRKVVWTYGVGPAAEQIRNYRVGKGRFIRESDLERRERVLVLGAVTATRLFGRRQALGETVRLDGHPFRVVGVSHPKGLQMVNMGPRDDEQVLLPITTAQSLFTFNDRIGYILFDPRTREEGDDAIQRVRSILSRHHRFGARDEQAVDFYNSWEMIRIIEGLGLALHLFLSACGLLTLIAGAVGVMNIMLVAVTERTRELALRKALGASNRDVFVQLLAETLAVTLASGAAGVALGAGLVTALRALPGDDFLIAKPVLTPDLLVLSFAILVGTGIAAGLIPARRAARLDPAEGLRDE
jgi:putative ABC transport system permease protein